MMRIKDTKERDDGFTERTGLFTALNIITLTCRSMK